jgi:hypothetical protein
VAGGVAVDVGRGRLAGRRVPRGRCRAGRDRHRAHRVARDGAGGEWSDWDFLLRTDDFSLASHSLPQACLGLGPVIAQWDRLSPIWCYLLLLAGPVKVDLLLDEPHPPEPPWQVRPTTLAGIDDHFWEQRFDISVSRLPERAVSPALGEE